MAFITDMRLVYSDVFAGSSNRCAWERSREPKNMNISEGLAILVMPAVVVLAKVKPAVKGSKTPASRALAFVHWPLCIDQSGDARNGGNDKRRACIAGIKLTVLCALAFIQRPLWIDQVGDARKSGDDKGRACSAGVRDTGRRHRRWGGEQWRWVGRGSPPPSAGRNAAESAE